MNRHYQLLGIPSPATLSQLKSAYHALAKKNHPDLFPDDQRRRQQLKMMRINEAYMSVMSQMVDGAGGGGNAGEKSNARQASAAGGSGSTAGRTGDAGRTTGAPAGGAWDRASASDAAAWLGAKRGNPDARAVAAPRDPAYTYYKAGFRYYRLGATELFRKEAPKLRRHLMTTGTADGYILRLALRALHYFERSYSYFLVVADEYGDSPWAPDARYKLRRLEKFSAIYQRICENLSRRSSTNRSSFSMESGADPS